LNSLDETTNYNKQQQKLNTQTYKHSSNFNNLNENLFVETDIGCYSF